MAPTGGRVQRRLTAAPMAVRLLAIAPPASTSTSRAGPTHVPLAYSRHGPATRRLLPYPRRPISILRT